MGLSIDFYVVKEEDFKDWRKAATHSEYLMRKFVRRHKKTLDAFEAKMDAWSNDPRSTLKNMPKLAEHEWMTKSEFSEWFWSNQKEQAYHSYDTCAEMPQLYRSEDYWLVQWVLNRKIPAEKNKKTLRCLKEGSWVILDEADILDLMDRLQKSLSSRKAFLKQFPILEETYGEDVRRMPITRDGEELRRTNGILMTFKNNLEYILNNMLSYYDRKLVMWIC